MARKKAARKGSKSPTRRTSAVLDQFSAADLDRWDQLSLTEQTFHDRVYYDLERLKKFVDIIKRFQLSTDTIKFGKSAGFPTRSLITTTRELHKRLLAAPSAWRSEPSSFGIPAPNQIFGYLAKETGFEALLYPSQQGGSSCLAVFNENFVGASTTSFIQVRGRPPAGATHIVLDRHNLCL